MKAIYRQFVKFTFVTAVATLTLAPPVFAAETHKVQPGETLWSIARQYNTDVDTLARINSIKDITKISEGMELKVSEDSNTAIVTGSGSSNNTSVVAPQVYKIGEGETLWSIARRFSVDYQKLVEYNNLTDPNKINAGMEIKIPPANESAATATVATVSSHVAHSDIIWPAKGRITSPFGSRWGKVHEGIDLSMPVGQNVAAASAGRVVTSGWMNGYGYCIIVDHGNGLRTLYGHLSRLLVNVGATVNQGEIIALSGNSGRSTGPHLHFEVQKDGHPVDPMTYLQ